MVETRAFPLAPMDRPMAAVTYVLLALPMVVCVAMLFTGEAALVPIVAGLFGLIYGVVWFWSRPRRFTLDGASLTVHYPMRRCVYARSELGEACIIDKNGLKKELGFAVRIGVGGLWGVFGWLWTRRHGWVDVYLSRSDRFLWIERRDRPPVVLTCESMDELRAALAA